MHQSFAVAALHGLVLALLACASPERAPEPEASPRIGVEETRRYVNDVLGVRLAMPEGWILYSEEESAPLGIVDLLRQRTGPTAGTQMVGHTANGESFVMLTAQPAPGGIHDHFDQLLASSNDSLLMREASISDERESVRWRFSGSLGATELTFLDTATVLGGNGVRLSFWTLTPLFDSKRAEFEEISESVEFHDGTGWQRRWEGLDASLSAEGLDHIVLVPAEEAELEAELAAEIVCADPNRHLLWRIQGSESVVYLFGSIHIGRPDFYPLAPVVEEAFASSDHLVVEVDMSSPEATEHTMRMMQKGRMDAGDRTLREEIGPEMYATLEDAFAELGLTLSQFEEFAPWTLALTLSMLKLQNLGYLPAFGVESYFTGQLGDRIIIELESAESQLALFESLDGTSFLTYTLDSLDTIESQSREMMESWLCGDDEALAELLLGSVDPGMPGIEEFYEKVFYERNIDMADGIEPLLDRPGTYFVLVGAGHLVGERSIIDHLRKRGHMVERH